MKKILFSLSTIACFFFLQRYCKSVYVWPLLPVVFYVHLLACKHGKQKVFVSKYQAQAKKIILRQNSVTEVLQNIAKLTIKEHEKKQKKYR